MSEEYRSGLSTEYQTLLAFQSGVDQEEEKKEVCNGVASAFCVRLEAVHESAQQSGAHAALGENLSSVPSP